MPELPEVEITARRLAAGVAGAVVESALAPGMVTMKTFDLFFAVIRLLLEYGVTHVAEAAFQHTNWVRGLEPLRPLAELRILRCHVPDSLARIRAEERRSDQPSRAAHDDAGHFSMQRSFEPIQLDAPTLDVDTTNGYDPDLEAITAFVRSR